MKVIIAGGREFTNYDFIEKECNNILKNLSEPIEIVSGLARNVVANRPNPIADTGVGGFGEKE